MPVTSLASRWQLRHAAEALGLGSALGGPQPNRRQVTLLVQHSAVLGARDTTARWRGRMLICEESPDFPKGLRALALALAELSGRARAICVGVTFALGTADDSPLLVDVAPSSSPHTSAAVTMIATITAGEPALSADTVDGVLTGLNLPPEAQSPFHRGDTVQVATGTTLATVTVTVVGDSRSAAIAHLTRALAALRIDGVPSNLALLRAAVAIDSFRAGLRGVRDLDALAYAPVAIAVLAPGLHSTVQDVPGRTGTWSVGVPPSGPMDPFAFRLANRLVGNAADAAGIEMTMTGPTLRFLSAAVIALTGADCAAHLDGVGVARGRALLVNAGQVLRVGSARTGMRAYLAVRHGIDVPRYLGSRSTFDLGGFGGLAGRALKNGDVLPLLSSNAVPSRADDVANLDQLPANLLPTYKQTWLIGVLDGPHGAPDFFTPNAIDTFFAAKWTVHAQSSRTGVRLIGPTPEWARRDGGDAGLHPSNIHDNAYAVGTVDFTGDMPIILGPDGPSLGGFVCPVTIPAAERWKIGQLRGGDRVRFERLDAATAAAREQQLDVFISTLRAAPALTVAAEPLPAGAVLKQLEKPSKITFRRQGDRHLLIEYGENVLDLELRLRVHLLHTALSDTHVDGITDLTPGVRSLQVQFDPHALPLHRLIDRVGDLDAGLPPLDAVAVPTRTVHLPLSWDDPATRAAIRRYERSVRADAPWCPSNIEFIRRINGLPDEAAVQRTVLDASYLVLGLGDVYLGAPVATPLDPRHRLVTTKYNPARTWTPPNAVGIGGAYLCIYGMEGPGGYQFVGRTVPVWNTWRQSANFEPGKPWLLRAFDQLRFHLVSAEELLQLREKVRLGTHLLSISDGTFRLSEHRQFLATHATEITTFRTRQQAAFHAERERWASAADATKA